MANEFDKIKGGLNIGSELLRRKERESERVTSDVAKNLKAIQDKQTRIQAKTASFDKLTQDLAETTMRSYADLEAKRDELEYIAKEQEKILNEVTRLENEIKTAKSNVSSAGAGSQQRAQNAFMSGVRSAFSPRQVSSNISQYQSSPSMFPRSASMASSTSSFQVEQQLANLRQEETRQRQNILEIGQSVDGREHEFKAATGAHQSIQQRIAQAQGALSIQRRSGTDIRGYYESAQSLGQQVAKDRGTDSVRELVSSGKAPSLRELQTNIKQTGDQIVETLTKFNAALESSPEKAEKLGQELANLGEEYSHHKNVIKELKAQGVAGGGWGSGQGTIIGDIGRLIQAGGQMYRQNYITSEFEQTDARIGMARLANERFADFEGATKGDGRSIRRILSGAYESQIMRGEQFGDRTDTANLTELIGKIGQTVDSIGAGVGGSGFSPTGIAEGFATGGKLGGALNAGMQIVNAGIGGLSNASSDILESNRMLADYRKDISRSMNYVRAAGQVGELQDQISYYDDKFMTSALDYKKGVGLSARGFGVAGSERIYSQLNSTSSNFRDLTEMGLKPDEIASLTGVSAGLLGSDFRGGADLARAQGLAREGRLQGPGQYVQARGMLSDVGGSAADFEQVLTSAIANGMDNSKNIMQMTQATTQLSSRSAQMGADVAGAAIPGIGLGAKNLMALGLSSNLAMAGIRSEQQRTADTGRGRELTIGNVVEAAMLHDQFSDAGLMARQRMSTLSYQETQAMIKDPSKSRQYGLDDFVKTKDDAKKLAKITNRQTIIDDFGPLLNKPAMDELIAATEKHIDTGEPVYISDSLRKTVQQGLGTAGRNAGAWAATMGLTWAGENDFVGPQMPDKYTTVPVDTNGQPTDDRGPNFVGPTRPSKNLKLNQSSVSKRTQEIGSAAARLTDTTKRKSSGARPTDSSVLISARNKIDLLRQKQMQPTTNMWGQVVEPEFDEEQFSKDFESTLSTEEKEAYAANIAERERLTKLGEEKYDKETGFWDSLTKERPSKDVFEDVGYQLDQLDRNRDFVGPLLPPSVKRKRRRETRAEVEALAAQDAAGQGGSIIQGQNRIDESGGMEAMIGVAAMSAKTITDAGEEFSKAVAAAADKLQIPVSFSTDIETLQNTVRNLNWTVFNLNNKLDL